MSQRARRRSGAVVALACGAALLAAGFTTGVADAATPLWELDPAYGAAGLASLDSPALRDDVTNLAAGPDGTVVAVGSTAGPASMDATVAKLQADGTPDRSFNGGQVTIHLGDEEEALAAAVQPDGKIVIAGTTSRNPGGTRMFVARLLPSGARDTGFGENGVYTTAADFMVSHRPGAIALGPGGTIVVAALLQAGGPDQVDTEVLRLTASGRPDGSFGTEGLVVTAAGPFLGGLRFEYPRSVAISPDGRVLVAAQVSSGAEPDDGILLLRYLADGRLDPTFGSSGLTVLRSDSDGVDDRPSDLRLLPDGGALVAAGATRPDGTWAFGTFLARVDNSGRLDPTFGIGAGALVENRYARSTEPPDTLLPAADGGWWAVGAPASDHGRIGIAKFDAEGRPDPGYGRAGFQEVRLANSQVAARRALLDGAGRILVAATIPFRNGGFVARLKPGNPAPVGPVGDASRGYWMVEQSGVVHAFGGAPRLGDGPLEGTPWVDIETTPSGQGYWLVGGRGDIACLGDAQAACGDPVGDLAPGDAAVSLSATPSGRGWWVFTRYGRVFTFGDAAAFGDLTQMKLNGIILDSIPTRTGGGYYMVGSDGGVFAFGDARFHGSMGGTKLNQPIQSLVPTPDGAGYWLVAEDGGVFAFNAPFRGSMGSVKLNRPITGMVAFGSGYLMVGDDGGIFNFSERPFSGSLGGNPPRSAITSVAAADPR